eukprot:gene3477-3809_t
MDLNPHSSRPTDAYDGGDGIIGTFIGSKDLLPPDSGIPYHPSDDPSKQPFLVIKNSFPKSSITQIMSNYFKKFVNKYAFHNDSKVYVTANEEMDEYLGASGKMERGNKFHSNGLEQTFAVTCYSSADSNDCYQVIAPRDETTGGKGPDAAKIPSRKSIPRLAVSSSSNSSQELLDTDSDGSSPCGRNVIIVDDSVVHRKILTKLFSGHGFEVVELADGLEAVELLARVMQTLPAYEMSFQDLHKIQQMERHGSSVKVLHDSIEQSLSSVKVNSFVKAAAQPHAPQHMISADSSRSLSSSSGSCKLEKEKVSPSSQARQQLLLRSRMLSHRSSSSNLVAVSPESAISCAQEVMIDNDRIANYSKFYYNVNSHLAMAPHFALDRNCSFTAPSSSCTTARGTPRLLQYALIHSHQQQSSRSIVSSEDNSPKFPSPAEEKSVAPESYSLTDGSTLSLEDSVVDCIAPQVMLKIRKENIDLSEFLANRAEVLEQIDNQAFNDAYFAQTRQNSSFPPSNSIPCSSTNGSPIGKDGEPKPNREVANPAPQRRISGDHEFSTALEGDGDNDTNEDHPLCPAIGIIGRQNSTVVREMVLNSPRIMNDILIHLSPFHGSSGIVESGSSMAGVTEMASSSSFRVESYDEAERAPVSWGRSKRSSFSHISNGLASNARTSLLKNSLTNTSHVYADSMASALNISTAFQKILSERWKEVDIIIMDFVMVNMNGPEAVELIRSMGYKGLIIGLTAKALSNDINIFLIHGVDAVFSKPLNWNLFVETYEILSRHKAMHHEEGKGSPTDGAVREQEDSSSTTTSR